MDDVGKGVIIERVRALPPLSRGFLRCMRCHRYIAIGDGVMEGSEMDITFIDHTLTVYGVWHEVCPEPQGELSL